jgi:hypothetical protein
MQFTAKAGGTHRTLIPPSGVRVSGTWRSFASGWIRVSGTWQQFYSGGATGTYSGNATAVYESSFPAESWGILGPFGGGGSWSGTTDSNGMTMGTFIDVYVASAYTYSAFSISGFSSDPGAGYFTSIYGKTSASASYGYSSGVATWTWTDAPFGISTGTFAVVMS